MQGHLQAEVAQEVGSSTEELPSIKHQLAYLLATLCGRCLVGNLLGGRLCLGAIFSLGSHHVCKEERLAAQR